MKPAGGSGTVNGVVELSSRAETRVVGPSGVLSRGPKGQRPQTIIFIFNNSKHDVLPRNPASDLQSFRKVRRNPGFRRTDFLVETCYVMTLGKPISFNELYNYAHGVYVSGISMA